MTPVVVPRSTQTRSLRLATLRSQRGGGCDDGTVGADRWSDVLVLLAAMVGLGVLARVWPRPSRVEAARLRHPSAPAPVSVELDTGSGKPRWRVSTPRGSPPTSLDIITWQVADVAGPWVSDPAVEPVEIPSDGAVVLATVVDPTVRHAVVLAWTVHHPTGDIQGSRTVSIDPDGHVPQPAAPRGPRRHWAVLLAHGVLGAAICLLGAVGAWRLVADGAAGTTSVAPRPPEATVPATAAVAATTMALTTVTSTTVTETSPSTTTVSTSTTTTTTTTTTSTVASPTSSTVPDTTSPTSPTTTDPTTTSAPPTTAAVGDGVRTVAISGRVEDCRFGAACVIAGFELVGLPPAGEYVCEFDDGSRFAFRYTGGGADDACATSGPAPSITIEVDGVRSATITASGPTDELVVERCGRRRLTQVTRPLQIGVQLPEVEWEVTWPELISMAQTAEAVGFDSIWLGDHLLYELEVGSRGPWEVWTSLAVMANVTERVELGPLVASTAFHTPAMLAKLAATVEAVSAGRLILGLGAGWNHREFEAFDFPFDRRVARFAEAFTIVRELARSGRCTFEGEFSTVHECVIHPRGPRPAGPPILVGSIGPRMLRLTLPHVDLWNVWWSDFGNSPAGFAAQNRRVDEICVEVGRDPGEVGRTCALLVQLDGGQGRQMGDYTADRPVPISGSPAEIADRIAAFADVGAQHVQLVVDPITEASIEHLGRVLEVLDA